MPKSMSQLEVPLNEHSGTAGELIAAAQELLEQAPPTGETLVRRLTEVRQIARRLDELGGDGSSLIRFGMSDLFALPILGLVALSMVAEQLESAHGFETGPIDVDSWRHALGVEKVTTANPPHLVAQIASIAPLVTGWAFSAPFDYVIQLRPATKTEMTQWALEIDDEVRNVRDFYRWLVDRTCCGKLTEWETSSLELEYRAHNFTGSLPVPSFLVDHTCGFVRSELDGILLRKLLVHKDQQSEREWVALTDAARTRAISLLHEGRRDEAAALFEFLLAQRPGDADLQNNLAFCHIPDAPADAYQMFREAKRLGYKNRSLHVYNKCLCAQTDSDMREVLVEASHHWVSDLEAAPQPATVWVQSEDNLTLKHEPDVRELLPTAVSAIATRLGELDKANDWRNRKVDVSNMQL